MWIFFASPVPAATARHLGFSLLRETMAVRGDLALESYDRFFPSQDTLVVHKTGQPAWFVSQLRHLASLHNPVFYERQKLRLSTYRTPRFIRCYEEDPGSLVLPRGVLAEVRGALISRWSSRCGIFPGTMPSTASTAC